MILPYLWLPAVDATSTINGQDFDIDAEFSDIWDNFDVFALMGRGEARRGSWFGYVDFMYLDLDGDFGTLKSTGVNVKPDIEEYKVDFGLGYRMIDVPVGDSMRFSVTPYVGGRWTQFKQKVGVTVLGVGDRTFGDRKSWWEFLVGGAIKFDFTEKLTLFVAGDAGGFGWGDASDLTWQAGAGLGYRFTDLISARIGYFAYGLDYETGSGFNRFGFDGTMHGPRFGVGFHF